ncbi:hypothetical protein L207DRAFT_515225 [Hyaloscypha variabilis F]|uniref:Uncharacterized protein n=1 Tax=Hyaloscypha variabilis (strain UAMH 11265 / GT02V1 / F) TaxID=1149755 RepID=A0A2J6RDY3_HYAVF|nr:hypothetical protein L207DRAFT_515225 [Hyaloscypha variabilis F]
MFITILNSCKNHGPPTLHSMIYAFYSTTHDWIRSNTGRRDSSIANSWVYFFSVPIYTSLT